MTGLLSNRYDCSDQCIRPPSTWQRAGRSTTTHWKTFCRDAAANSNRRVSCHCLNRKRQFTPSGTLAKCVYTLLKSTRCPPSTSYPSRHWEISSRTNLSVRVTVCRGVKTPSAKTHEQPNGWQTNGTSGKAAIAEIGEHWLKFYRIF